MVAVWVDPAAPRRDGRAARQPRRDARGDRGVRATGATPAAVQRARRRARHAAQARSTAATECASPRVETRRYSWPWEPPLRVAWDPEPRRAQEATIVIVRSDDGVEGYASGDALPDRALLERLLVGVDPLRTEIVRELCETVDFHHGRPWTVEVAVWDLVGRALGVPVLAAARRALRAPARLRVQLRARRRRRARARAASRCATRACARSSCASTARTGARTSPIARGGARRRRARLRDHGRRQPGLADARRPARRAGTSRPPRSARASSRGSASTGSRSRCAATTPRATAALRGLTDLRIAAGEMVRTAAEARDLVVRGGVDVIQTDVVLVGRRHLGLPPRRRARRAARAHVVAAHVVQRLRPRRQPAPRARRLGLPLRRGALRPAGAAGARAATGCCRRRSRSTPTAASRRPPGPGLGVVPDFDALERWRVG